MYVWILVFRGFIFFSVFLISSYCLWTLTKLEPSCIAHSLLIQHFLLEPYWFLSKIRDRETDEASLATSGEPEKEGGRV